LTPEDILGQVCGELGVVFMETTEVSYKCYCSRERVEKALITLGAEELTDMIQTQHGAQVDCHFCNKRYRFSEDDLQALLNAATAKQ